MRRSEKCEVGEGGSRLVLLSLWVVTLWGLNEPFTVAENQISFISDITL